MPSTICPKCRGKNAYESVLFNYSAVRCSDCGYHTEPQENFVYTQEDLQYDQDVLDSVYGDNE